MIRAINWRDERKLNVETFGFSISNNTRQTNRRNVDSNNTMNASNSVNRNIHNIVLPNTFYKHDTSRYHQPPPNSFYPPYEMHMPNKYYYQPRWFSRRPDYRIPSYVQAWN